MRIQVNSVLTSAMLHGVGQNAGTLDANRGFLGGAQQVTADAIAQVRTLSVWALNVG